MMKLLMLPQSQRHSLMHIKSCFVLYKRTYLRKLVIWLGRIITLIFSLIAACFSTLSSVRGGLVAIKNFYVLFGIPITYLYTKKIPFLPIGFRFSLKWHLIKNLMLVTKSTVISPHA